MIAREGVIPAAAALLLAAAAVGAQSIIGAVASLVLVLGIIWAFRDREPLIPALPLAVLSPIDGRLLAAGERRDPWLDRKCMRLSVKLSTLGMGVIRSPTEGQIKDFWVRGGVGRDEDLDAAASPTSYALWIQTDEGDDVVLAVYGRRFVSRFKAEASPGERIGQGKRLGFVYFGTTIVVYAPQNAELEPLLTSAANQRIKGGSQVLATLVHNATGSTE